jgi:hypothetical protein
MDTNEPLKPCPLCGGKPYDHYHGVSCTQCGLWLGNGTRAIEHGGYKKAWNHRASESSNEHPDLQRADNPG